MLIHGRRQRGVSLVEAMIGLAIIGVLLTQAVPTFSAWLQNQRIRNTAEAILNGLQLAKAQAVRSNLNTELALLDAGVAPVAANVGAAASTTGTSWIVRTFQSGGAYSAADFVQGRSASEGSGNATVTAARSSFVFTPLGRLLNPPPANMNIDVSSSSAYPNKRPMRVIVSPGGQFLMCDPNKTDPTNPQFCP